MLVMTRIVRSETELYLRGKGIRSFKSCSLIKLNLLNCATEFLLNIQNRFPLPHEETLDITPVNSHFRKILKLI